MVAEKSFHGGASVGEAGGEAAKFEMEEGEGGGFEIAAVAIPPGLFEASEEIVVDVLGVEHFAEAGEAVGASPAGEAGATVRSFGDGEAGEDIINKDGAGAKAAGDLLGGFGVGGPDAGGEGEFGLIGEADGFVGVGDDLNGHDGAEGFVLKEMHGGIDVGEDGGLEKIGAEIGAGIAAIEEASAFLDGVGDEIGHARDVLGTDERAEIGGGIGAGAETKLARFFDAEVDEGVGDGFFDEETFDGETDLAAIGEAAPKRSRGGDIEIGVARERAWRSLPPSSRTEGMR